MLSLIRIFHDEHEHASVEKTMDLIFKHFWFLALCQFVTKYTAHCLVCISKKRVPRAPYQHITSWEKPDIPFAAVHLDALGPLPKSNGRKFVLLIVDAFSKYTLLNPMFRQDPTELKRALTNAISLFGTPKQLVTDEDECLSQLTSLNRYKSLVVSALYHTGKAPLKRTSGKVRPHSP